MTGRGCKFKSEKQRRAFHATKGWKRKPRKVKKKGR